MDASAPTHIVTAPTVDRLSGWSPQDRARLLQQALGRDGGRCGLCGNVMDTRVASQVLLCHIVPLGFAAFDIDKGQATEGRTYRSVGSHIDNLQAVHAFCDDRRGDTLHLSKWRHRNLPQLPVAESDAGRPVMLPSDDVLLRRSPAHGRDTEMLGPD